MFPVGVTVTSILTDAATVVTQYAGLIGIVLTFAFGVWGVGYGIRMVKSARH